MFFFVVKTNLDFIQSLRLRLYKSGYTMHRMFLEIYMAREKGVMFTKKIMEIFQYIILSIVETI